MLQLIDWLSIISTMTVIVGGCSLAHVMLRLRQNSDSLFCTLSQQITQLETRIERLVREEATAIRIETANHLHHQREDNSHRLDTLQSMLGDDAKVARQEARENGEILRKTIDDHLTKIMADNTQKLDEIRRTVGEKLDGTLERRLGDSFRLVSNQLEQVHKGLGEMQTLAIGVGDLKRVMTNIKTRGIWGEIQLGNLLEQLLAPEQFACNVATKKLGTCRVEFAIKMPGHQENPSSPLWLPIDAKFPIETYQRLLEAQDKADAEAVDQEARQLEIYIKQCARDICEKYISPPDTTDFGVMYLPTEGLFAEVARRTGLIETLQRDYRVIVAGPTTLAALLNSLQMGFRTLAIQKRSSEVWEILAAVKTEFGKFGDILRKVEKKLQEAGHVIESAGQRSRAIERKLRNVQVMPTEDALNILPPIDSLGSGDSPEV